MQFAEICYGAREYVGCHRSRASDVVLSGVAAICEGAGYEEVEEEREDWEMHDEDGLEE